MLEKAMAPHSSTLAWKIPWMEEPGRLQTMGSRRVGHAWATSLSLFTFMHWWRKWQSTPVALAWRIPGMGEPGGPRSMGSHRVGHNWSDLAAAAVRRCCFRSCWRRKWQPTLVFLPGKSHGQRDLAGYSPWGRKESDMTERLTLPTC